MDELMVGWRAGQTDFWSDGLKESQSEWTD